MRIAKLGVAIQMIQRIGTLSRKLLPVMDRLVPPARGDAPPPRRTRRRKKP